MAIVLCLVESELSEESTFLTLYQLRAIKIFSSYPLSFDDAQSEIAMPFADGDVLALSRTPAATEWGH